MGFFSGGKRECQRGMSFQNAEDYSHDFGPWQACTDSRGVVYQSSRECQRCGYTEWTKIDDEGWDSYSGSSGY